MFLLYVQICWYRCIIFAEKKSLFLVDHSIVQNFHKTFEMNFTYNRIEKSLNSVDQKKLFTGKREV